MYHRNADDAFSDAIRRGFLSETPGHANYARDFMYLYSEDSPRPEDAFKHVDTRRYLWVPRVPS